jgi:hypothetical protein
MYECLLCHIYLEWDDQGYLWVVVVVENAPVVRLMAGMTCSPQCPVQCHCA